MRSRISTTVAAPCRASSAVRSSHASATTTSWTDAVVSIRAARRTAARQEGSRSSSSCAGITTPTALITPAVASSLSLEQAETLDRFVTVGQRAARRARPGSVRDALHGGRSAWPHPCQPRSPAPPTGRPGHCPAARVRYPGAERRGPGSSARRWLSTPAGRRAAGQRAREGQALAASSGAGLHSGGPRMRPRR